MVANLKLASFAVCGQDGMHLEHIYFYSYKISMTVWHVVLWIWLLCTCKNYYI